MLIGAWRNGKRCQVGGAVCRGGELELIARFPGRPSVRFEELGTGSPRRKRDRRVAA